ncbi:hypothetical protein [Symbiopectobacterium purcellii]|uniref:hypothetical protein n=1 Tax=Symbiopectobacterium purcellii TaxID=2871826 RepID=UPI003F853427
MPIARVLPAYFNAFSSKVREYPFQQRTIGLKQHYLLRQIQLHRFGGQKCFKGFQRAANHLIQRDPIGLQTEAFSFNKLVAE